MESLHTAIILEGDFNPTTSNGFQQKRLERHCNLKQIVMQPTRDTNTLDLIFTHMVDCYETPVDEKDNTFLQINENMISENFRGKTVRIGRVRNLRRQISAEFRKDLFL